MVQHAGSGLVSQGSANLKLMEILHWVATIAMVSVAYGNMPLSKQLKPGYPENTVIGKICLKQQLHFSKNHISPRLIGFIFPFLMLLGVIFWSRSKQRYVVGQCYSGFGGKHRRNMFTYSETYAYNCLWCGFIIVENLLLLFLEYYSESINVETSQAIYHLFFFLFIDLCHGLYLPIKYLMLSEEQYPRLWYKQNNQVKNSGDLSLIQPVC